jgi:hypothetical protein
LSTTTLKKYENWDNIPLTLSWSYTKAQKILASARIIIWNLS